MERLARLGKANAEGIDMVAEAVGLSKHDLMSLGLDADQADGLLRLAGVYFPISRTKEAAVAAARANGHNWKALLVIEGYVRQLDDKRLAWGMRTRLCRLSATHAELKRAARAELERLNGKREPDSTPRMKKITSAKYGTGFVFYGPELELANIFNGVNALSGNGTVEDNGAALLKLIDAGGCRTEYSAVVGITLDELTRIEGSGEEEVALIASDGARMTGAEFVRRTLAGRGYVVLVDPVAGPVNLYEVRAASAKQRTMLAALWPRCEEPRCSVPASRCHVHHLHSYHHGGQTNIDNLGMLCKYHNGTNDDNPHAPPRRGRVEHRGLVSYKRWPSGTVEPDRSESMANRLLREIAAQAGSVRDLSA